MPEISKEDREKWARATIQWQALGGTEKVMKRVRELLEKIRER